MHIPAHYNEPVLTPRATRTVEAIWTYSAAGAGTTLVLPDGRCDVIVRFNALTNEKPIPIITGPATRPMNIPHTQGDTWVGLRLRPGLGRMLWGDALEEVENTALRGDAAVAALPTLARLMTGPRDLNGVRDTLLELVSEVTTVPAPLQAAIDATHFAGGRLSVDDLAHIAGCTARHLRRLFRMFLGIGPKTYAQLVRFHRSVALLKARHLPISDVATEAGYADQAHMTRDIALFGGFTPACVPPELSQPGIFA